MSDYKPSVGRGRAKGRRPTSNSVPVNPWLKSDAKQEKNCHKQPQFDKGEQRSLSKFEEACAKIRESSRLFLDKEEFSSSDDEDDDSLADNIAVIDKVISPYSGENKGADLGRTEQFLLDAVKSGVSICLICIASVKKSDAVWSCEFCYCLFHLPCIQIWAKDSLHQKSLANEYVEEELKWCCPKCRQEYARTDAPKRYICFCGKVTDPEFDPWQLPHTCGQTCERNLKPFCGHKCRLLCHPGPCPSCPQTVQTTCHCRKQRPQTRRCSHKEWACGQTCGALLLCGQHTCKESCHSGDCSPCPKQSLQSCVCGKEKCNRPCADPVWQCTNVCGRLLSCGSHKCDKVCHSDSCGDCPRSKERSCPCGKTSYNLPCTEDVPACGDTCGKLLACGVHSCSQRCHFGSCGTCLQMRVKRCRCGQKEKSVPCHKEYLCETKCKRMRDCGRHPCNRKCCEGNCPPCEQPCGRTLGCRNHKCSSQCHQGPCYPCPIRVDVKCFCGATCLQVPCGREKVTRPPKCGKRCQIQAKCHHPTLQPHRCHFSDCPPCTQVCGKELTCGHVCPEKCHSAVLTKVETQQKRAGPWEPQIAPKFELVCKPCPPCKVPMPVTCLGKHETQNFPCFMAKPSSCHRKCGRCLACGNHGCRLDCHEVKNAVSENAAGDDCGECEEPCSKARPDGCTHPCLLPCHREHCPPCRQMVRQRCHCGVNTPYVQCHRWTVASLEERTRLLSCGDQCPKVMTCGHRCKLQCHDGPCTDSQSCQRKVTIRCACKRIKKELQCSVVQKEQGKAVLCDEVCRENKKLEKKQKAEEEAKKRKETQEKEMEELEKYKRKMEGKKRKPRKQREVPTTETFWTKYKWTVTISTFSILLLAVSCAFIFKK